MLKAESEKSSTFLFDAFYIRRQASQSHPCAFSVKRCLSPLNALHYSINPVSWDLSSLVSLKRTCPPPSVYRKQSPADQGDNLNVAT